MLGAGTSVATPLVAAAYALAGRPAAAAVPAAYPYLQAGQENDVLTGGNGTCGRPFCTAGAGWDGPTGLGSLHGGHGVSGFTVTSPGDVTVGQGLPVDLTLTARGGVTPYTWSATALPGGLTLNPFTGVISGTAAATGSTVVGIGAVDALGVPGGFAFTLTVTPTVLVPDVVGISLTSARVILQNAGLGSTVSNVRTCDVPAGVVLDQNPLGGGRAAPGSAVRLQVSQRPPGPHACD
jgi:putative Ig domain-containing protein/PASTA domain-containing protein